jgi:hypothetical protein
MPPSTTSSPPELFSDWGVRNPRTFWRSTGSLILGFLPSNYLRRLQFGTSQDLFVPNFVPDGAQPGLSVTAG